MWRRNLSVLPRVVVAPPVEEKKADEETNASGSQDAQAVGVGVVSSTSKAIAPINGIPAPEESAAEQKETDERAAPSQPLGRTTQGKRPSMRANSVKLAQKSSNVAHHVW